MPAIKARRTILDIEAVLRQVPLFEGLSEEDLAHLRTIVHTRSYPRGTYLCEQGGAGEEFLILIAGSVKVDVLTPEGKELTLTLLKPYHHLGEMALLDDSPRSANVVALEDTRVLAVHKHDFRRILEKHPQMFFPIVRHLARRLRVLTEDVASLAYLDAYSRVARKVLHLADQLGVDTEKGEVLIPHPITHQELANLVGATRETVTKILNEMKDRGLLSIDQHKIKILQKAELVRALM
ncbi:MAG TPA: Crp/Fnr family transcriptional regulator [Candidatus Nitrosotenuis sp.]|jgi:CRP-like cAMP-binding protein|nr:Crp/Fnr family transcriptional regulator [Candidatus Nitrosotenuis sp.]